MSDLLVRNSKSIIDVIALNDLEWTKEIENVQCECYSYKTDTWKIFVRPQSTRFAA